jgi:nucleoside-diphosphate-sugar epimerase
VTAPLIILGCGYVGARLARAALAAGRPVRVCARGTGRLAALGALGAEVKFTDVTVAKQLSAALHGLPGATVVYAVPVITGTAPPTTIMRSALHTANGGGAACFVYFSSSGLYGTEPDDDVWIDEETPPTKDDPTMRTTQDVEEIIQNASYDRMRTVILRLAPVYGPGRGVRERMLRGDYRLLEDGRHAISRIHVDDVVRVVTAAEERAETRSLFMVADDEPTTQLIYATWLAERLGVPLPASRAIVEPGKGRAVHRNRKIRNQRVKAALGIELQYPTFREGEVAIEAERAAK